MAVDEAARTGIETLISALQNAWNSHDYRAFAACFAEDADHTNIFGLHREGRPAIEASHTTPNFTKMFNDSHYRVTDQSVRFIRPDVALIDLRWEMTGSRDPQGNEAGMRFGLVNLVATKEMAPALAGGEPSGVWLVKVFHNQDLPSRERVAQMGEMLRN